MASSSSSSSMKHDVFLSFRGKDTRCTFTSHLYAALRRKNIDTFIDDEEIERGHEISPTLLAAIERSKISIVIFSKGYASSTWCLDELAKIIECKNEMQQILLPIFYNIDPSDVRKQCGVYADAFAKHEKFNQLKVDKWRRALQEAANSAGWDSSNIRLESHLIENIVEVVMQKLTAITSPQIPKGLVRVDNRMAHIESLLCNESADVHIVSIWGTNIMMGGNGSLPTSRGARGRTPLQLVAWQRGNDMARHISSLTIHSFQDDRDWIELFFLCINAGTYDLALEMLEREPNLLALARNESNELGLHVLARKPSGFSFQGRGRQNRLMNGSMKPTLFLQLVRRLWSIVLHLDQTEIIEMRTAISEPWHVIFMAVEVGNLEFLTVLLRTYPDLIWEVDHRYRILIHIGILYSHARIFNLIHEIDSFKDVYVDDQENSMLHHAAKLSSPTHLSFISGDAFQMIYKGIWFEEVKEAVGPSYVMRKNRDSLNPRELFIKEHEELLETLAEFWMKEVVNSYVLFSRLIDAVDFFAAFIRRRGNNDKTGGTPNYLEKPSFLVFAICNATLLISFSCYIYAFLSCSALENDFRTKSQFRTKSELWMLKFVSVIMFISNISMMAVLYCSFFIDDFRCSKWVLEFVSGSTFLPICLFLYWQYHVWSDIVYSIYRCKSLLRPTKHLLNQKRECAYIRCT